MMNRNVLTATALAACAGMGMTADAAITYVDAQEGAAGNTYATGGSLADTSWIDLTLTNTGGSDNDDWILRSGGATATSAGFSQHNGSDVIQAVVSSTGGLGEITTEITGLADGTYNVWVFFWEQSTSGTQNWVIDAGLTSGALTAYSAPIGAVGGTDSSSAVDAGTLTFTNAPSVAGAETLVGGVGTGTFNQRMFGVNLGQVVVSGGSDINVYVDKLTGLAGNNRTIYDGVGYELVPEPGSMALLGLGGLLLARRRRN